MADLDIVHFGVTGFTGKLVLEHFLNKKYDVKLAVCARNAAKALELVDSIAEACKATDRKPLVIEADLVCKNKADEDKLRAVVKRTKVVITTAGPFEKYGKTLLRLCAEEGVHYADITGESDFVRSMIGESDAVARKNGACCVVHAGNDVIPYDLTAFEMNKLAKSKGYTLTECRCYTETPLSLNVGSGGTITTAVYQLGKTRAQRTTPFDELLMNSEGNKSDFSLKNRSPSKAKVFIAEFEKDWGPWVMQAVMVNGVRRSNALLGYNSSLEFGEGVLSAPTSWGEWFSELGFKASFLAAIYMPSLFSGLLPSPGEGPSREQMLAGFLKVHGRGTMTDGDGNTVKINSLFQIDEDPGYLSTSRMLVESGMLLLEMTKKTRVDHMAKGVITPACAFGSDIVARLEKETCTKFTISTE
jgi:short subunit dehydrogenase-like uncharacterized protein